MKNNIKYIIISVISMLSLNAKAMQSPLSIGYSVAVKHITLKNMQYAKSVGISCVETSLAEFIDKQNLTFLYSDEEIITRLKAAKAAANEAGIKIWSVHMPFSPQIDLSLANETERKKVIALHKKVLEFCTVLQPQIILFHPSYFLGRDEREIRKNQMLKSAKELNELVRQKGFKMVVENMLGPDLVTADGKREWPLCRDVAETVDVMSKLPASIGSAIDFNHIKNPETLILAMGSRLTTIHVSDGDGLKERHYLPCSGKGQNNWKAILAALDKVGYNGPFLYECHFDNLAELKSCYDKLLQ